ncbi:MAG TPA: hypothetical protein VF584_05210 [Longimicrobium sp.]|jgi:hypothetical protein
MQAPQLRPRRPGEILDTAFQIVRARYDAVLLASAVFLVPAILLALALPEGHPVASIADRLLTVAGGTAVIAVVSDIYTGEETDVRRSIGEVVSRFGSVFGAAIIQGIMLVVGLLLFVVPAFIFYAWTFAMPAIVMLEGAGAFGSYSRSRALAKGYVGHILATLIMAWVIFGVVFLGAIVAVGWTIGMLGVDERFADPFIGVVLCLIYPFIGVVTTILYYDLRIRQEGFDVEFLAGRMDDAEPGAPPAVA